MSLSVAKASDYLDFELEVGAGAGGQYPAVITRSPAGQGQAALRLTFDETALEDFLKEPDQTAAAFGQALYTSLFVGDIQRLYAESLQQASQLNKGVRLKVRFQPPELAALPWEYMFSADLADYVCLSPRSIMARYQAVPIPRWPLLLKTPLRILGVVASPPGLPALNGEAEKQSLENALRDLKARGLVNLTWLSGANWQNLEATLAQSTWNILHLICHSDFSRERGEDYLILADSSGGPLALSAAQLGQALARQASLRLVVLNVFEETQIGHASGLATDLVSQGLPAVLVIPHLSQHAAHVFAPSVYEALVRNGPVDIAVKSARERVRQAGASIVGWGLPALYMHAPDGLLFNVLSPAEAQLADRAEVPPPVPQRTELDHLVEELAQREIEVQEATERLAQLRIEIARLAGEQTERSYQIAEFSKRAATLKSEVARLSGEQAERERQVEAVTQRLLTLMAEADRLTEEHAERQRHAQAAEARTAALSAEGDRLTTAQAESERQLLEAASRLEALRAEAAGLAEAQAAVTADLDRLRGDQAERERQARQAAERLAAQQASLERLEAEKAERERQLGQNAERVQALEADVERLTRQAEEQARLAKQEAERVQALQAEAQRLSESARANWARARLRYLSAGAAGGMVLLAMIAGLVMVLSRLVH